MALEDVVRFRASSRYTDHTRAHRPELRIVSQQRVGFSVYQIDAHLDGEERSVFLLRIQRDRNLRRRRRSLRDQLSPFFWRDTKSARKRSILNEVRSQVVHGRGAPHDRVPRRGRTFVADDLPRRMLKSAHDLFRRWRHCAHVTFSTSFVYLK